MVGAYVGADITAGVLSSALYDTDALTLFIDVAPTARSFWATRLADHLRLLGRTGL